MFPRQMSWQRLSFLKSSHLTVSRLVACLPIYLVFSACQSPDGPTGPAPSDGAASDSTRSNLESILERAIPPGMRNYRAQMPTTYSRIPASIPMQLYQSVSVSIGEPTDLGTSFVNTASFANAINASGQLAGWTIGLADGPQVIHAIRWGVSGMPVELPAGMPDGNAVAKDLNDAGVVVGWGTELDEHLGLRMRAMRWNPDGSSSALPMAQPASAQSAEGINNSGVVVGWAMLTFNTPPFETGRAIRWDTQGAHLLPGAGGVAYDVNDAGTVVGYVETPVLHPAKWSPSGTLTVLPLPDGATFGFATGINNLGQVVGTAGIANGPEQSRSAVTWAADGTLTVIPNSENAEAVKINDAGVVVGYVEDPSLHSNGIPGVIWFEGERIFLPPTSPGLAMVNDLSETQLAGAVAPTREIGRLFHAARWSFTTSGVHFDFAGFFAPVRNPGGTAPYAVNKVKAGQAVPIKFSLHGNQGLDILAPGNPRSKAVPCTLGNTNGGQPTRTAGGRGLSYHRGSDRYQYGWKTEKAWAGTCRQLMVSLTDGTTHSALFKFKK
jgi:uncharacterized membrane protein